LLFANGRGRVVDERPGSQLITRAEELDMARYGKMASEKVERAMHERKRGELKSGRSGKTVKSRAQAVAIGLSEARKAGGKVPAKKTAAPKKTSAKKAAPKKARTKKTTSKKATPRKTTAKRATPKRASVKKSAARKTVAKRAPAKRSARKKTAVKKTR
jgi:hypothetical protein